MSNNLETLETEFNFMKLKSKEYLDYLANISVILQSIKNGFKLFSHTLPNSSDINININNNIFMPKSKVLNKNHINFNENFIENNINKKEYCEFCKEIENINEGKEILHEFTKKLSDFIIINNDN